MSPFIPTFTITNAVTAGLTTIERARGFLEAATLSDEWVRRMRRRRTWLEFFVSGLATQLAEVKARGEIAIRSDLTAQELGLNPRQAGMLDHLLTHGTMTLRDIEQLFPDVSRRSLQRDIKIMLSKNLMREIASSSTDPNRHYIPAEV